MLHQFVVSQVIQWVKDHDFLNSPLGHSKSGKIIVLPGKKNLASKLKIATQIHTLFQSKLIWFTVGKLLIKIDSIIYIISKV